MCPIVYHSPTSQNCAVYKHLRFTQTGNSYFKMAAVHYGWMHHIMDNRTLEGFIHHHYYSFYYCISVREQIHQPEQPRWAAVWKKYLSGPLAAPQCRQCGNNYLTLPIPSRCVSIHLASPPSPYSSSRDARGLTFYASIVVANHHIIFPQSSNNPASIFKAWLNLDLDLQTCFYNGMDAYAKPWQEFVFSV